MKKIIAIILSFVMTCSCLVLQGCGESEKKPNTTSSIPSASTDALENAEAETKNNDKDTEKENKIDIIPKKPLKASDLSINDFPWETNKVKKNGETGYEFTLTNNSDYDIIDVTIVYKLKDDVPDSDLALYADFMKEHEDYIDEDDDPRDVTLIGNEDLLLEKGQEISLMLIVGFQDLWWYEYPTDEQFALMEPKELEIGVVGEDETLYIAYYDFEDESWMLDSITTPADCWSDSELAQMLTIPQDKHHVITQDKSDTFRVYAYGVTEETLNQYIEDAKNAGFEEDYVGTTFFEYKHPDGYELELDYNEEEESLKIEIQRKD